MKKAVCSAEYCSLIYHAFFTATARYLGD